MANIDKTIARKRLFLVMTHLNQKSTPKIDGQVHPNLTHISKSPETYAVGIVAKRPNLLIADFGSPNRHKEMSILISAVENVNLNGKYQALKFVDRDWNLGSVGIGGWNRIRRRINPWANDFPSGGRQWPKSKPLADRLNGHRTITGRTMVQPWRWLLPVASRVGGSGTRDFQGNAEEAVERPQKR
ncbi:MAG: hypothetical protein IIB46_06850 [Nitrospinae bacterium]|nr:hypothetical protein [Nitrospinota bacterium]